MPTLRFLLLFLLATMAIYKWKHLIGVVAYSFRVSVHYHHGGEHGNVQIDAVLEK